MSASVQRRVLEEELRLVLEQKAAIEAQLAALRSGGRGMSQQKSLKRNSSAIPPKTHVPPTKKQKVGYQVGAVFSVHVCNLVVHLCSGLPTLKAWHS